MHKRISFIHRALIMAVLVAAVWAIGGAVSSASVTATMPPPPTVDNWHQAWRLMTRGDGHWCAEMDWSGQPGPGYLYDCTTAQPPFPSLVREVSFREAMRLMADGWGVTRPHRFAWMAAPQGWWF